MIRKLFVILTSTAVILSMSAVPSFSGRFFEKWNSYAKYMRHSHKTVLHMYLVDENGQWNLTRRAPKGRMIYNLWGEMFNFTFKGKYLSPNTPYTLLYCKENSMSDFIQLGEGVTGHRGRLYFKNTVDVGSMPAEDDSNSDFGARILLVPSDSISDGDGYFFPNPDADLEGSHLIRFVDTNGCQTHEPVDEGTGGGDSVITEPPPGDELANVDPPGGGDSVITAPPPGDELANF